MNVKLRPDAHLAPVPEGLYVARGEDAFVVRGRGLFDVLDERIDLLAAGATLDEMVAAAGNEAARPVYARLLDALLARGVLLDLDRAGGPVPDPATGARYREVLGFLETRCDDPYARFARLRALPVAVTGDGSAAVVARRALARLGVGPADGARPGGPPALTVAVAEHVGVPETLPVLPVYAGRRIAFVGPVCTTAAELRRALAVCRRAVARADERPEDAAARPASAALAGSLAAAAVLELVLPGAPPARATVVHGRALTATAVPLAPAAGTDEPLAALLSPWTGPLRRGEDRDVRQLPMARASVTMIGGAAVGGWGRDRAAATTSAVLAALRVCAGGGDGVPAAGLSEQRWLADGALRALGAGLLAGPGAELGWGELTGSLQRGLWDLLTDYLGFPGRLEVRPLPGDPGWVLASWVGADGRRVSEWGPGLATAVELCLGHATALAQGGAGRESEPQLPAGVGTAALEGARTVRPAGAGPAAEAGDDGPARRLLDSLAAAGRTATGVRWSDPVLGTAAAFAGRVLLS